MSEPSRCQNDRTERRYRLLVTLLSGLLTCLLSGLLIGCAGSPPVAVEPSQSMKAFILPPAVERAQGPRLRVDVPRRDLVFRSEEGRISGGLEVTVVAWRHGRQVGGGVSRAELTVPLWGATRSDSLFSLELPVVLDTTEAVDLDVRARSLGSSRSWVRRIPCPPTAWQPLPFSLAHWEWNAAADGVLDGADSLHVDLVLARQPLVPWPATGCGAGVRLKSSQGEQVRVLRVLTLTEAQTDTVRLRLAVPAEKLPLGAYELELGLGNPAAGGAALQIRARRSLRSLVLDLASDEAWQEQLEWLDHRLDPVRKDELSALPARARPEILEGVWQGPGDRREHLLRIVEADTRFAFQKRGALTDRGLIFVEYGPPARIERRGSPGDRFQRWEYWFYDGQGMSFLFLDSHGLGEYRLIKQEMQDQDLQGASPD